jgi:hypothetical protein
MSERNTGVVVARRYRLALLCIAVLLTAATGAGDPRTDPVFQQVVKFLQGPVTEAGALDAQLSNAKQLMAQYRDNPLVATEYANLLSLRAKLATTREDKAFFAKQCDIVLDRVIAQHPDFVFAYASRGLAHAMAPAFLGLDDSAARDFDYVLAQDTAPHTEDEIEALIITDKFYPAVLDRLAQQRHDPSLHERAELYRKELHQRFPDAR